MADKVDTPAPENTEEKKIDVVVSDEQLPENSEQKTEEVQEAQVVQSESKSPEEQERERKENTIARLVKIITNDEGFSKRLEESVQRILHDGKINQFDIPEMIFIITDAYMTVSKSKVKAEDLPEFIEVAFNYLCDKLDIMTKEQRETLGGLVSSSVKLAVMQSPLIKSSRCFGCF